MKYKALIVDLDGTTILQGSDLPSSDRVTQAIARLKDKVYVCVATARPLSMARVAMEHLDLTGPCVLLGGAQIYDPEKKKTIQSIPLKKSVVPKILTIMKKFSGTVRLFNGEGNFPISDVRKIDPILTIFINGITDVEADELMSALSNIPNVAVHKMPAMKIEGRFGIEATDALATKLHGIVELQKILGVTKEETIGVGDSYNDFPLLMASGLKIAMGNAVPELKAIADFIAPSVEEDGVATVIEKFILSS